MTAPDDGAPAGIGHNTGTEEAQIRDNLAAKYEHMNPRTKELLADAELAPDIIPEDQIGRWQDLAKSMKSQVNALDNARAVEKAPYDRAAGVVQNYFIEPIGRIEAVRKKLAQKITDAKEKLKARLQREAEEEARKKREEAERVRQEKEAEERERKRIADEAEAERQRIQKQKEDAERERQAAIELEKYFDMLELARLEAESEDMEREAQKIRDQIEETKRKQAREKLEREAREQEEAAAALRQKKLDEAKVVDEKHQLLDHQHRRASYDDDIRLDAASRTASTAAREAERAAKITEKAVSKENTAVALEKKIENADGGEFGRTRGDLGSVATLRKEWTFANIDVAAIDLEALRHHIPLDGLERGVRAFIKAGGRECRGVDIFEQDALQIR